MYLQRISTFVLVLTAACCLFASQLLLAQSSTTGEISGTVSDPSGAVVPNVPITLKSIDKGFTQSATSNSQGAYRFSLLAPGNYAISATAPGFKTTTVTQPVAVGAVDLVEDLAGVDEEDLVLALGAALTAVEEPERHGQSHRIEEV